MSNGAVTYYVDEAGDGVLFGPLGRDRLQVSVIHDVDDRTRANYGRYLAREGQPPDPEKIKNRWI